MVDTTQDDNFMDQLTAFADGELDTAGTLAVLEYLAMHPEAMQWVRDQQRLKIAATRALTADFAHVPTALRDRIVAIEEPRKVAPIRLRRPWRTYAAAAAVLVALGFLFGQLASRQLPITAIAVRQVVPASVVAHVTRVHADCSRLAIGLHSAGYPENQGKLAQDVERDLHSDKPYPDLTPLGFRYVGAGPCGDPLPGTIHLLYHSIRLGSGKTVSLFVQEDLGQYAIDPDHVYSVSVDQSPFPMLVWRTARVVYFLVADDEATEQGALNLIRARGVAQTQTRSGIP